MLRRRKVSADDLCKQKVLAETASPYAEKDRKLIQKLVQHVVDPGSTPCSPLPAYSPEIRGLLFVDEDHVVDRATQVVAATNLVVSLILSGVLESCLRPVPVADFTSTRDRVLVEIYNTLGGAVLTLTLGCSLYTTYFLMSLPTESPSTIYAGLANGGRHFVTFQILSGASAITLLAMICVAAAIWSTPTGCIVTCSVVGSLFIYTTISFIRAYRAFCPSTWMSWGTMYPGSINATVRERSARLGKIRLSEAPHLAEIVNDGPSKETDAAYRDSGSPEVGQPSAQPPPGNEDLAAIQSLLLTAVPNMQSHRVQVVAKEMLLESMTVRTLRETVSCEGGLRLIYDALNFQDEALLRRGERMAVASLLLKQLRAEGGGGGGGGGGGADYESSPIKPPWEEGYELRYHSM